jgi:uncharacterized membrane protein
MNMRAKPKWRWRPFHAMRARPRMMTSALIFVVISSLLYLSGLRLTLALLLGFDIAAVTFLSMVAWLFNKAGPEQMRPQAKAQDSGRWGFLWSGIVLTGVVMVALGTELHSAKGSGVGSIVLSSASVVLSWLFMNTMFAMHYAHGYYGNFGKKHEGLQFPETPQPDYWDFAYFAIVIGMTFQVSDVQITSRYMRRVALLHSVIAFFFNVFIIALTVNVVAGQA